MRTTLTLDEDVAHKLQAEVRRSGRSFRETVNELLRLGLQARPPAAKRKPFVVVARDLQLRPGFDLSNVWELVDQLEGPRTR